MNLLSYGATLKLVIGWQKKKGKKRAKLPWDANSIAEQLKVGGEWSWSPFSGKSLCLQQQQQTLARDQPDSLLVVKTGSSHPDGMQSSGQAARLLGYCRLWKVLEQPLTQWLLALRSQRVWQRQPDRQTHRVLVKTVWRTKKPKWATEGSLLLLSVPPITVRNMRIKMLSFGSVATTTVFPFSILPPSSVTSHWGTSVPTSPADCHQLLHINAFDNIQLWENGKKKKGKAINCVVVLL